MGLSPELFVTQWMAAASLTACGWHVRFRPNKLPTGRTTVAEEGEQPTPHGPPTPEWLPEQIDSVKELQPRLG